MSSGLRSSGGSGGTGKRANWKVGVAALLALTGVSAAVYSVWPVSRPAPPMPLDLRQARGPMGGAPPMGAPGDSGPVPAGETRTVAHAMHGEPPPGPPVATHPAERVLVKPDASWPDVRTRLAKSIEAAAQDVAGMTDPKARTAGELGQAGATAIMALLCDDSAKGEEATKELGGEVSGLAGQPAAGRIAGMLSASELDIANPRVLRPARAVRAGAPPIVPPPAPDGQPKRRAMMLSMNQQRTGDQTQTTMSLATPDLFPAVNAAEASGWPSWEVRVPVKLGADQPETSAPCEAMVVLTRQASTGRWQPSNWGIVFHDPSGADAFMKGIRTRAAAANKQGGS